MDADQARLQAQYDSLQARVLLARQEQQQRQQRAHGQDMDYHQDQRYDGSPYRGSPRGGYRVAPYPRGRGRGRVKYPPTFRNQSLVLNGSLTPTPPSSEVAPTIVQEHDLLAGLSDGSPAESFTQVTNKIVKQEHEVKARVHPPEYSKQKRQEQDISVKSNQKSGGHHEVVIDGMHFEMREDGSKLTRLADASGKTTPLRMELHRQEFRRTKNGNLLKIAAKNSHASSAAKPKPQCKHFTQNGTCFKGPGCHFTHDPKKVAICKTYFHTGNCANGNHCDLSHKPTYERVPACSHFMNGNCNKPTCRYAHVDVSPGLLICRPFAILGYCDQGKQCDKRHLFECPDWAEKGACPDVASGKCKLQHVTRAHLERKARRDDDSEVESSDEDNAEVLDDDIDSDDSAEDAVMTGIVGSGHELTQNQDFISFS